MRILVQNKLVRLCCPIALGLHRHSPLPGPAPASRRGRTHSPPGHGYAQLYLGKGPDNHSTAQRGPGSPTCRASPRSLEQPRPPAPVRGRCDLRASPATALVCRFSLFHSKGSCGHVQLTGPKEFKNKTTRQRVKLMQVFSFCFFMFLFCVGVGEEGGSGASRKKTYVQGVSGRGGGTGSGHGGRSGQAGSSLRTRERCGRRFPSQESASFL